MTVPDANDEAVALLMEPLTGLAIDAGNAILAFNRSQMATSEKSDGSPVTGADIASDKLIAAGLQRLAPDIPVISEERPPSFKAPYQGMFFLVDPLDGTKEYVAGRGEYAVCIALIMDGRPVLGVIAAPAMKTVWRGGDGHGAQCAAMTAAKTPEWHSISSRAWPEHGPWTAIVSRSHLDPQTAAFIASRPGGTVSKLGSAVKFCRVAEGQADVYPRLAPTSEWDLAAGCAILQAAGGFVGNSHGQALRFGQNPKNFLVPEFIAWGDPAQASGKISTR